MLSSRLSISLFLVVLLLAGMFSSATAQNLQHFEFAITDANMSVLITEATLDGESLLENDEIGIFTADGLCAGGGVVPGGFPDNALGIAAWGAEQGQNNGFAAGGPLFFRYWLNETDEEVENVEGQGLNGALAYQANGFLVVTLAGELGQGNQDPNLVVDVDQIDFGVLRTGRQQSEIITLTNDGRAELVISSMDLVGDHAAQFMTDFPDEGVALDPGDATEYMVTYAPQEEGPHDAILRIESNDPDGAVDIALNGRAEPALPPMIELSTDVLNFGNVLFDNARELTITITNSGDETLDITDVETGLDVFVTDFEEQMQIPSGSAADLTVTFTPVAEEVYATDMIITSNDPENGEVSVRLSGRGVNRDDPSEIAFEEGDEEHFFGYLPVGEDRVWRFPIMNTGAGDLIVSAIEVNNDVFSTDFGQNEVRIRNGDRWYVDVTFMPEAPDFFSAALTIFSNDPETPEVVIPIGGVSGDDQGTHFQWHITQENHSVLVLETALDGEPLVVGDEIGLFTPQGLLAGGGLVEQDGRAGLRAFGNDPDSDLTDGFVAGEAFGFVVWDADAEIEADAAAQFIDGPEVFEANGFTVVNLTAETGDPDPVIAVQRTRHYFGQVRYEGDETADWAFTIVNNGLGDLIVAEISSDLNEFTTDFEQQVVLAQYETVDVTVIFDPTEERRFEGRLTITSNDPNREELYIDVIGDGVVEPRNPEMIVDESVFFGVGHIDQELAYTLTIESTGGADLVLTNATIAGDEGMVVMWDGNDHIIPAGEEFDLNLSFTAGAEQEYNGILTLETNIVDQEQFEIPLRGLGAVSDDHYLHLNTGVAHSIIVTSAIINTLQDHQVTLYPGDEVGVFTPQGLCAGHTVIAEMGAEIGVAAYAADQNNIFMDGFRAGHDFMFKFWDSSTEDELECRANFVGGPEVFQIGGESEVELEADAISEEALLSVDPMVLEFGAVRIAEESELGFVIENLGGEDLTVQGIESDDRVYTTDFAEQVVIPAGESIEVTAMFRPRARIGYEGALTITSNDPHQGEFALIAAGIGSEFEGYFVHPVAQTNHSILITSIDIGGAPPAIDDEIGVFTPAGLCAGASIIEDPRAALGVAAWGDEEDTEYLVEGFTVGEAMTFRFFDFGSGRDLAFENVVIEVGPEVWAQNGFTVISEMSIGDIFSIIPIDRIVVVEEDMVEFDLELQNAEGQFEFTWVNNDEYQNLANAEFDFANNVGHFNWQTAAGDDGEYRLTFTADNNNGDFDRIAVDITVEDVNQAPGIDEDVRQAAFGDNDEVHIQEDANWVDIVVTTDLFVDPDADVMVIYPEVDPIDGIEQRITNQNVYQIRPEADWTGQIEITLIANDQRGEDVRDLAVRRSVRNVRGEEQELVQVSIQLPNSKYLQSQNPQRDLIFEYTFTLFVDPVNDAPVVDEPAEVDYNVTEQQLLEIDFSASDVDNRADELVFTVQDRGDLPNDAQFTDNGDGTGQLSWTPDWDAHRDDPYTPTFRVADPEGEFADIQLNIIVTDNNRDPVIAEPEPDQAYQVNEGEELVIAFGANDADQDNDLTWTWESAGGIRDANFDDHGNGNATFTWTPAFDDARDDPYNPIFQVSDGTVLFRFRS